MVGPTEELPQIGIPVSSQSKEAAKAVRGAFSSPPNVTKKELEISKTTTSEVAQVTKITSSGTESVIVEQKIAAHALKKGRENVENKLKDEQTKTPDTSTL
jgi:hypothetical protein